MLLYGIRKYVKAFSDDVFHMWEVSKSAITVRFTAFIESNIWK